jgi:acetyl-CoA decarbonylase/synthase, CODH/ACS complex subunit delta
MSLSIIPTAYNGKIAEVTLGSGPSSLKIGGETALPLHTFEGVLPHSPRLAMSIWDCAPAEWPQAIREPFADVMNDPVAWASKCVLVFHADLLAVTLRSLEGDFEISSVIDRVRRVAEAVSVPLIIWGSGQKEKDTIVLGRIARELPGRNFILGPVEASNYQELGHVIRDAGHIAAASTPIDINLAKQLNILLGNQGLPDTKLVMDPTVSSIGYGLEYCYSVMERTRLAALTQGDNKLQFPLVCNLADEVWKTKEAAKYGAIMEAVSAMLLLAAGGDIIIMRHPEAIELTRETLGALWRPDPSTGL